MALRAYSSRRACLPISTRVSCSVLIQRWLLEAALSERVGLSNEEWEIIGALLPSERGRGCRPAQDNRLYFEGMFSPTM